MIECAGVAPWAGLINKSCRYMHAQAKINDHDKTYYVALYIP